MGRLVLIASAGLPEVFVSNAERRTRIYKRVRLRVLSLARWLGGGKYEDEAYPGIFFDPIKNKKEPDLDTKL